MSYIFISIDTLSCEEACEIKGLIEKMIEARALNIVKQLTNFDEKEENEEYRNVTYKNEIQLRELRDARKLLVNFIKESSTSE